MAGIIIKKWNGERPTEESIRKHQNIDEMNDPFARQKLVSWWDQDKIEQARVLVMGAGAIGNETLHNLALLGFKHIFICDMDTIELSNLSRTVLFRKADEGRKKAEVAAERTCEMCLAEDPQVDFFCGDIMYELGIGIFRHFDIVLGCLDNDATRFFIDRCCTMFGKPWINAGISELSAGLQLIYTKETGACFHCGESPDVIARVMSRKASCGKTAIADLKVGKIPTIQVASAIVSGLQAQETVKYVCGKTVDWGKNYYFQGTKNAFEFSNMRHDEGCIHNEILLADDVIELHQITNRSTMRKLLCALEALPGVCGHIMVDLSDEQGRDFIKSATCIYCGKEVAVGVPRFRFKDEMAVCAECKKSDIREESGEPITNTMRYYSLDDEEILDLTLGELGIPPLHVLHAYDEEDNEFLVELTGDLPLIAPNNFGKKE